MKRIRNEDQDHVWEGVHQLPKLELVEACKKRAIPFHDVTETEMQTNLRRWLRLSSQMDSSMFLLLWIQSAFNLETRKILPEDVSRDRVEPSEVSSARHLNESLECKFRDLGADAGDTTGGKKRKDAQTERLSATLNRALSLQNNITQCQQQIHEDKRGKVTTMYNKRSLEIVTAMLHNKKSIENEKTMKIDEMQGHIDDIMMSLLEESNNLDCWPGKTRAVTCNCGLVE